jgi:hypothetical protein
MQLNYFMRQVQYITQFVENREYGRRDPLR